MLKRTILSLFACVLAMGCRQGAALRYEPISLEEAEPLTGTVLCDSIATTGMVDMQVVGEYIVLAGFHPEYRCWLFDRQGRLLTRFCAGGKGPGEAFLINTVGRGEREDEIWAYDPQFQKLLTFSIDSLLNGNARATGEEPRSEAIPMNHVTNLWRVAAGRLALGGNGVKSTKRPERFALVDRQGEMIGRYGEVPAGEDTVGMKVAFNQPHVTISPDGTKMADGSMFGAILETFDIDGRMELRRVAYFIEPDFPHTDDGRITSFEGVTFGFGALASSDRRIYACYNGTNDPAAMTHIAVFDWDGRLEKLYKTDFRLDALCCDPQTETLYAVGMDESGEFRLVRFDLPDGE